MTWETRIKLFNFGEYDFENDFVIFSRMMTQPDATETFIHDLICTELVK